MIIIYNIIVARNLRAFVTDPLNYSVRSCRLLSGARSIQHSNRKFQPNLQRVIGCVRFVDYYVRSIRLLVNDMLCEQFQWTVWNFQIETPSKTRWVLITQMSTGVQEMFYTVVHFSFVQCCQVARYHYGDFDWKF